MRRLALIVPLALALASAAGAGEPTGGGERRAAYVTGLLEALDSLDPDAREALAEELYLGARRECRAGYGAPPAGCLLELADRVCAERPERSRPTCRRVADVVITNLASEWELVDESTRVRLMNASESFREAMEEELRAQYALLAAELALWRPADQALGPSIDRFCAGSTRARRLTWSRCVAAITWYIGTFDGAGEVP